MLARDLNVPMFIASTIHQIFGLAISQGYGQKGHTSIVQLMEGWTDTTIEG
jgi:3-hydroxyisobutyrate dehydrogenase-like beta-hydroxyacid dehydrogenase